MCMQDSIDTITYPKTHHPVTLMLKVYVTHRYYRALKVTYERVNVDKTSL